MVILWIHLVGFKGLNICTNVNQPFFSAKKIGKTLSFWMDTVRIMDSWFS